MDYGQDVYDSLENYIMDDRYHQAALLDGPWGSGKTWFIRKCFISRFKEIHKGDWHFIYLSLYGLESVAELKAKKDRLVAEQMIGQFLQSKGIKGISGESCFKVAHLLKPVASLLTSYLSMKEVPTIKMEDVLAAVDKPEHLVLIMDDLERAHIEPEIVLGYISELTEQEEMKVIVLANEAEICQANDLETAGEEGKPSAKNQRRERYDLIKEKTIGLDVSYQVPVGELYGELVDGYVRSAPLKKYIHEEKEYITAALESSRSQNLRTLIFAMVACDTFYPRLERAYDSWRDGHGAAPQTIFEKLVRDVIRYTMQCVLSREQGKTLSHPSFVFDKDGRFQTVRYSYSFVRSFIDHRRIKEEELNRDTIWALDDLLDGDRGRNEAYNHLMKWQLLDDCDVERYLEGLEKEILQKQLNPDYIRNLFFTLLGISEAGITVSMDRYVTVVITNLRKSCPLRFGAELLYAAAYTDRQSLLDGYNETLKPIYEWITAHFEERQKEMYQFLISHEWGPAFKEKCNDHRASFIDDRKFLAYVDPEEVIQKIKTAHSAEIYYFTEGVRLMYEPVNIGDFFKADAPCIDAILKGIGEMGSFDGKVKARNVRRLKEILEIKCGLLSDTH